MKDMRQCRAPRCTELHPRHMFCCRDHWYEIPKPLRDAIWRSYRTKGVLSDEYLQAAENAEAFLEDRDARDLGEVFA